MSKQNNDQNSNKNGEQTQKVVIRPDLTIIEKGGQIPVSRNPPPKPQKK